MEKIMDKRRGITVFRRIFFCLTVPKNRKGTLLCSVSEIFPVAKKFMVKRGGGGGREYQDFPSKIFCLTVPKISVGESFTVALISGIEKVWIRGGGVVSRFFVSQCRKFPLGNPLLLHYFRVPKKFGEERGGGEYQDFPSENFCLTVPKNFMGTPSMFQKIWGYRKNFMHNRGYHVFPSKIFSLTVPKNFVKEPFSVSLISGIKKC